MYQTIGSVRYSGWMGSATLYTLISFQIGDSCAALIHDSGTPPARAPAMTSGSFGSSRMERWAS